MGEALGQGGGLMPSGPSKAAEAIVGILTPPACREEVLGDLHERYRSPLQYGFDALGAVPLVILSRIRRTADPQVLVMQAFALYLSFLTAARFQDGSLLQAQWGLVRLAIPSGMTLLGLILEDAYAVPGRRSPLSLVRGPILGLGLALLSQGMLRSRNPEISLPGWILFYGCAMSLLLSSAIRLSFPPVTQQLQGVNAPAFWLKRTGNGIGEKAQIFIQAIIIAAIVAGAMMAALNSGISPVTVRVAVIALVFGLVAYQLAKRT
jgi:hypothetical protein